MRSFGMLSIHVLQFQINNTDFFNSRLYLLREEVLHAIFYLSSFFSKL